MAAKTTLKAIKLKYGTVGATPTTELMGVLKGLAISQDEPEATEIEAEFFDSPFDILYKGNPVTMTFELAQYDLSDIAALFGGAVADSDYEAGTTAEPKDFSWELEFQKGHQSLYIYKGNTIGTIKKDADGALNYSVTIKSLVWEDTSKSPSTKHLYKLKGRTV